MKNLQGKVIVITGASGGIGKEVAIEAAKRGCRLVLLARRLDKLQQLKNELSNQYGVDAYAYKLDVSDSDQIATVFQDIHNQIGEVDVLVNNAGFGTFKEAQDTGVDETKAMFAVNVIGLMACTKQVLPYMKERKSGHIINIASQAGKIATPKSSLYSSTKFAVLGYSNALRLELMEDHVYVTTVNPGPIETNFFDIADESGTYLKNVEKFMLKPRHVATKIVAAMLTNKREINLPGWMDLAGKWYSLFPGISESLGKKAFFKK
ncbi:SDR family oxidoreductase [Peribacillus sp. SI8-4]|uniref:SDR family NAD(P)-dependent oxidoreductase n=1 Tax=Peribacillus sp. SI8-4 TaxID=3048009 RepID=UPI002553AC54|nr:SDR family oxidoreductase [Peribacillus sp. SI8-4]